MKIIKFKQCNATYAKNQPQYLNLPSHKADDGRVTSCWGLSLWERLRVMVTGRLYLQVLTFNKPLQPLKMVVKNPIQVEGNPIQSPVRQIIRDRNVINQWDERRNHEDIRN